MGSNTHVQKLSSLLRSDREALLKQWRSEVRQLPIAEHLDALTLNDHMPALLEELACELENCSDESLIKDLKKNPIHHGLDRLKHGFDVEEVVAEYNCLRGVIQDLIESNGLALGTLNRTINRVIDRSIGLAVKTYAGQKGLGVGDRRKGQLALVAHDLRTPLTAFAIAAKILERTLPPEVVQDEQHATLLDTMHRNVSKLSALVVKVLREEEDLTALLTGALEVQKFNLKTLVDSQIGELKGLAGAAGTQLLNQVPEVMLISGDSELIGGVLQNLLSNALEYTKEGVIRVGAAPLEGWVECWVQDNGEGIPPDRIKHIFQKLETNPKRKGVGLGLAIVKQSVEAHGGEVEVESELGRGATFRFRLPVSAPAAD